MPNYGVIDLGSNTIRLVIYEVKNNHLASYTSNDFRSLINDKVMAGLAAFVSDGVFTQEGIERAILVLEGHMQHAYYFQCEKLEVFATAVLRNVANREQAVAVIEERTGLPITVLSERDEAHLGYVGIICGEDVDRGTLVDVGGGSTELTRIKDGNDSDNVSVGQGSLSSFTRYVRGILPTPDESERIAKSFRKRLAKLPDLQRYRNDTMYAIGGSARAAAKMHAQALGRTKGPKTMTAKDIRAILKWSYRDPDTFAHTALKASAERIHTLVPGCVILLTLLEELGASQLSICKYGIREGYLIERMLLQP